MDPREKWFLQWRMRQAAFALLGAAAVAWSAVVPDPGCAPAQVPAISGAPSIVIMIDHSASMRAADPGLGRYRAAARLLERVHGVSPDAEAAIIVFSDILHFDWRDDAFLQPAFPGNAGMQYESYVPFTRLDRAFADGNTGLDTLRAFLRCGALRPEHATDRRTGYLSDFPMAFDAARSAFRRSGSPASRRMLVIITDGESPAASAFGGDSALARFQRGADLPAAYALWLRGESGGAAPASLADLVANIGGNGYSAANPRSFMFTEAAGACDRATALSDRILADIADPVPEPPVVTVAPVPCPDVSAFAPSLPRARAGNSLAHVPAGEAPGSGDPGGHWLLAGLPAMPPGTADWSCCRFLPAKPGPGDSDSYIHVTLESDRPFEVRAKVFSRFGEPVARAAFRIDGHAFGALPASPRGRTLDLYWDGHAEGGAPAATGAYAMTVEASDLPGPGNPARKPSASARRIGILRSR